MNQPTRLREALAAVPSFARQGPTQIPAAYDVDHVRIRPGYNNRTAAVEWSGSDGWPYTAHRIYYGPTEDDVVDLFLVASFGNYADDAIFCGLVHPSQILSTLVHGKVRPFPFYPNHVQGWEALL
jgi:hypothetical protein